MSLPPKVFIHVGMTKAGSTSLQNVFDANRAALVQQGILFPETGFSRRDPFDETRTSGHLALLRLLERGKRNQLLQECAEYGDQIHTLVLSAENLFLDQSEARLRLLKALFRESEVNIIAVLRHQLDWILSRYTESVTKGWQNETRSIDRYCQDLIADGNLEYAERLVWLRRTLRARRIYALDYGRLVQDQGLIPAVLRLLRVDQSQLTSAPDRKDNRSVTAAAAVEAQRRINFAACALSRHASLKWCATQKKAWRTDLEQGRLDAHSLALSAETREALEQHLVPLNKILAQTHLKGKLLRGHRSTTEVSFTSIDSSQVIQAIRAGLQSFANIHAEDTLETDEEPSLPVLSHSADEIDHLLEAYLTSEISVECGSHASTLITAALPERLTMVYDRDDARRMALTTHLDRTDTAGRVVVHTGETLQDLWQQSWFRHPDLIRLSDATPEADLEVLMSLAQQEMRILVPDIGKLDPTVWQIPTLRPLRLTQAMATLQFTPANA